MFKKARLIFLSANKAFGGGEEFLCILNDGLRRSGYDCYLYIDSESNHPHELLYNLGVISNVEPADILIFNGVGSLYKYFFKYIFHSNKYFIQHSLYFDTQSGFLRAVLRTVLLAVFLPFFRSAVRVCGVALPTFMHCNIRTIYNGVAIKHPRRIKRTGRPFQIAIVGTLNDNKNQLAGLTVLNKLDFYCRLLLIGDGPGRNKLEEAVASMGLTGLVDFCGYVADPRLLLRDVDVLLIPSQHEAFPLVALEAFSMGIPVVANKTGGLCELIDNGVNGFLCNRNNVDEFVSHIKDLNHNESIYSYMSDNAYNTYINKFSDSHMVSQYIELIEGV